MTHQWYGISFAGSYGAPRFVASRRPALRRRPLCRATGQAGIPGKSPKGSIPGMATYSGKNNCALRYRNLAAGGVEVKVEEDTTWDTETLHWKPEAVAYLAIEGDGLLTAVSGPGGDSETSYYYFGGQRVAMRQDGVLYFIVGDHLGTTSAVFDASGILHSQSRHYPYGTERWVTGAVPTDYRFTGQRLDSYIKLTAMGARWYDGYLSHFISPDSIIPDPRNPQSFNRYSYGYNNSLI